MTREQRESIRERCNKATTGPWKIENPSRGSEIIAVKKADNFDWILSMQVSNCPNFMEDADFIANTRQDIPALLDALEAAEKRADALERAIKKNTDACCFSCVSFEQCIAYGKATACILAGWNPSAWQFDQARFEGKEKNNE